MEPDTESESYDIDTSDLDTPDTGAPAPSQHGGRTFTQAEVSAIVQRRLSADRARAGRGAPRRAPSSAPASASADPGEVAARVAAFMGAGYSATEAADHVRRGYAPPAPPPASSASVPRVAPPPMPSGSPPARVSTDETPFYLMSRDEQAALIKRIGPFEFKKLAFKQLAESGQRFSLRR